MRRAAQRDVSAGDALSRRGPLLQCRAAPRGRRHDLPRTHDRTPGHCPRAAARAVRPDRCHAVAGAEDDRHAPHRRRRPVLPVHAQRGLGAGRGHRQVGQLRHRPGRRRACRGGREDGVRLLRRHLRSGADGRRAHRAHDRGGRAEPHGEGRRTPPHRQGARAVRADRPDRHARQHAEGRAAREGGEARPREGPARQAGDGRPGQRVRRGAGGACRRHAGGRRAAAGAPVGDGDRRADGRRRSAPRVGQRRRRRALRPRLLPGQRDRELRARRRERGADEPRIAAAEGRPDERRARPGLARRAAARGHRPRARGRLQPQGVERVLRPHRTARGGQGRDRARRRHAARPARLAQRRRRGQRVRSATC